MVMSLKPGGQFAFFFPFTVLQNLLLFKMLLYSTLGTPPPLAWKEEDLSPFYYSGSVLRGSTSNNCNLSINRKSGSKFLSFSCWKPVIWNGAEGRSALTCWLQNILFASAFFFVSTAVPVDYEGLFFKKKIARSIWKCEAVGKILIHFAFVCFSFL